MAEKTKIRKKQPTKPGTSRLAKTSPDKLSTREQDMLWAAAALMAEMLLASMGESDARSDRFDEIYNFLGTAFERAALEHFATNWVAA